MERTPAAPDNSAPLHADRVRAESFGSEAERYDRARPGYPSALVDALLEDAPTRVLDVGTGTGKAARLLIDRGCEVIGVEPDGRMAAIARDRGVVVEVARFEDWDPRSRAFDLVTSAQAWHWVEPEVGYRKAASLLRARRRLALFWNHLRHDPAVRTAFVEVYTERARALAGVSMALGRSLDRDEIDGDMRALSASGAYDDVELRFFDWTLAYGRDAWLDYLMTCSDHIALTSTSRDALLDSVGAVIDSAFGGVIEVRYRTHLITARARGRAA